MNRRDLSVALIAANATSLAIMCAKGENPPLAVFFGTAAAWVLVLFYRLYCGDFDD